jgi:hypothetical protein
MLNRRLFLLGATAAFAGDRPQHPVGWPAHPPKSPIRSPIAGKLIRPKAKKVLPRPTISCLDSAGRRRLFQDLEKGYDELLRRAPGPDTPQGPVDPTSLLYHMWVHAYYCGEVRIHSNWFFLPWHRAFLYFHERILQSIVGDHFRLPVWEWDRCPVVPPFYPDWANGRLRAPYGSASVGNGISAGVLQAWLQSNGSGDFLGGPQRAPIATSGPHNLVHDTFGTTMAVPSTAALDPLFYTHHANVDRFWEFWRRTYGFGDDDGWKQQAFGFYDRDGEPVSIQVGDLLDLDLLGYSYPSPPSRNLIYPCRVATQSGFDPDTMSVRFSAADFEEILRAEVSALAKSAGKTLAQSVATLQSPTLPCRIYGMPGQIEPGRHYLVGMRSASDGREVPTRRIVGGFGVFMDAPMQHEEVVATACLDIDDLKYLAVNNFQTRFVWGLADSSGRAIAAGEEQPFWPIGKVELVFKLPAA